MSDTATLPEDDLIARKARVAAQKDLGDWADTLRGVTVTWLMQAFRMDRQTVKRKLARCQAIGNGVGGQPLYDFVQAASFLVKPQVDIKEYVKSLRPIDLPPYLQDQFWASQLKRQQWEQRAGHLWKTDDVMEVFGETFKRIKTSTQLWLDNLEQASSLTDDQKQALTHMVDALNDDIYQSLIAMPKARSTRSSVIEMDEIENAGGSASDDEDLLG